MIPKKSFTLFIMMMFTAGSLMIVNAQEIQPVSQVAQKYEKKILQCVEQEEYREAILATAEYEQDLISRYKPPTYEMGLLQSEAEHIAFHCPFDWKRVTVEELGIPKELSMMGYTIPLALEGKSQDERLLLFCVSIKQLENRMGISAGQTFSSDQGLQLFSQMIAGNFGVIKSQRFQMIGDHRVLFVEVAPPMMGPDMRMVLLSHEGRVFVFILASPIGDLTANEKRLCDLVKTADFTYKPENQNAIAAERGKKADSDDIETRLKCIENLATLGEYNAAAEDLAELRLLLYSNMPKTTIKGDIAYCPIYGLTLKNPDSSKWKLSTMQEGVFEIILLEDNYSVNGEGIMIGVLDFVVTYGPAAVQLINDEQMSKQILVDTGRGGAMSMGQIESERFTTIKGIFAYEAIVRPNMPGIKARLQWINMPGYGVMFLMLGSEYDFQAKIAESDRIINNLLEIKSPPGNSGLTAKSSK